mmetsp:Transcript_422/g.1165  ORF Transcript_422/g.1165 Transcript_422/m.1165 type:complete len:211 (+) Transcript_422:1204-1836(+)
MLQKVLPIHVIRFLRREFINDGEHGRSVAEGVRATIAADAIVPPPIRHAHEVVLRVDIPIVALRSMVGAYGAVSAKDEDVLGGDGVPEPPRFQHLLGLRSAGCHVLRQRRDDDGYPARCDRLIRALVLHGRSQHASQCRVEAQHIFLEPSLIDEDLQRPAIGEIVHGVVEHDDVSSVKPLWIAQEQGHRNTFDHAGLLDATNVAAVMAVE